VVSSEPPSAVVDTVVLRYFLFVDQFELLLELLDVPLGVPRIVYDPDEGEVPELARSEITRSIDYQHRAASDHARDVSERASAATNAARLEQLADHHAVGNIDIFDMNEAELQVFGRLTNATHCRTFGLLFPLDPGEAACVAIANTRGLVLATDDTDALTAARALDPEHPYERIRKLLIRAATTSRISRAAANEIHREMRALGFWDTELPYPDV